MNRSLLLPAALLLVLPAAASAETLDQAWGAARRQIAAARAERSAAESEADRARQTDRLTALAAMLGAFFSLDDPIFNGLAISLIFGIMTSTLLTLVVIPLLYFSFRNRLEPQVA